MSAEQRHPAENDAADVDRAFAQRLADALIAAMCRADPDWDEARAHEVRAHMRTALAAVGVGQPPQCWCQNRDDGRRHNFMPGRGVGLCGTTPKLPNRDSEPCTYCQAPWDKPCYPGCASASE